MLSIPAYKTMKGKNLLYSMNGEEKFYPYKRPNVFSVLKLILSFLDFKLNGHYFSYWICDQIAIS